MESLSAQQQLVVSFTLRSPLVLTTSSAELKLLDRLRQNLAQLRTEGPSRTNLWCKHNYDAIKNTYHKARTSYTLHQSSCRSL